MKNTAEILKSFFCIFQLKNPSEVGITFAKDKEAKNDLNWYCIEYFYIPVCIHVDEENSYKGYQRWNAEARITSDFSTGLSVSSLVPFL